MDFLLSLPLLISSSCSSFLSFSLVLLPISLLLLHPFDTLQELASEIWSVVVGFSRTRDYKTQISEFVLMEVLLLIIRSR